MDTTAQPKNREGYKARLDKADWLLREQRGNVLKIVVAGGGCIEYNGYRVRQNGTDVHLEVFNTVYDPDRGHGCLSYFRRANETVVLPEPVAGAEVHGGCPDTQTANEGTYCKALRLKDFVRD